MSQRDAAKLPTIHCDVVRVDGKFIINIVIEGMTDLDETGALVRCLAMPMATAITGFYNQPPPAPEEFYMGPGNGSGSLH